MAVPGDSVSKLKVVVIGGTGATGKELVKELLRSTRISQLTSLGRRKVELSEFCGANESTEEESSKLVQHVVDFETLTPENGEQYFRDHDVFVTCFGTTRKVAGSAEEFTRIDSGYPLKCAGISKQCGIKHVILLSSQGAKSNSWVPYLKSKGLLEQSFIDYKFPVLSILRPGILDRGGTQRFMEKLGGLFLGRIAVNAVAKAICFNMFSKHHLVMNETGEPIHEIIEDAAVRKHCKDYETGDKAEQQQS